MINNTDNQPNPQPLGPNKKSSAATRKFLRGAAVVAASMLVPSAGADVSTTDHKNNVPAASAEAPPTTSHGSTAENGGERDPSVEAGKETVKNNIIDLFTEVRGAENAGVTYDFSEEPEGDRNSYTVSAERGGRKITITATATGTQENPDLNNVSYLTFQMVDVGKGEPTADDPNGDKLVGSLSWQETYIDEEPGRTDISGVGADGIPFTTQRDLTNFGGTPQDAVAQAKAVVTTAQDMVVGVTCL